MFITGSLINVFHPDQCSPMYNIDESHMDGMADRRVKHGVKLSHKDAEGMQEHLSKASRTNELYELSHRTPAGRKQNKRQNNSWN